MLGERRDVGPPGKEDRNANTLTSFPTPRQARQLHSLPQFREKGVGNEEAKEKGKGVTVVDTQRQSSDRDRRCVCRACMCAARVTCGSHATCVPVPGLLQTPARNSEAPYESMKAWQVGALWVWLDAWMGGGTGWAGTGCPMLPAKRAPCAVPLSRCSGGATTVGSAERFSAMRAVHKRWMAACRCFCFLSPLRILSAGMNVEPRCSCMLPCLQVLFAG